MDGSPPGSSVHGILLAKILQWVAIYFSRESSPLRYLTRFPALQADRSPSEPPEKLNLNKNKYKNIYAPKRLFMNIKAVLF